MLGGGTFGRQGAENFETLRFLFKTSGASQHIAREPVCMDNHCHIFLDVIVVARTACVACICI